MRGEMWAYAYHQEKWQKIIGQGTKQCMYVWIHVCMHLFQIPQGMMAFLNFKFQAVVV